MKNEYSIDYIAHMSEDGMRSQTVDTHLMSVAELTRDFTAIIHCPTLGYLTGILHDTGKFSVAFNQYIKKTVGLKREKSLGKLNHSAAGAILLNEIVGETTNIMEEIVRQMVCEAIFSHHSGLPDNYSPNGEEGYTKRFYPSGDIYYEEVKSNFISHIYSKEKIKELFNEAVKEIQVQIDKIRKNVQVNAHLFYHIGMLEKFLYSCLVDADWYDTECFMEDKPIVRIKSQKEVWKTLIESLEKGLCLLSSDTELGRLRQEISEGCKHASNYQMGNYLLKCPTGSGKTFSSLRFALHHALRYDKKRIFYIIPYTSIIDQNAKAIKGILGNDTFANENVYELHASLTDEPQSDNENQEYTNLKRRLSHRLEQPIILTTMVRFLNTFFSGKRKYERALHQFSDSVIIFDEVQTLPVKTTNMFNGVVNFLTNICRTTCILCTATQPLLHEPLTSVSTKMNREFQIEPIRLAEEKELFLMSEQLTQRFKRVELCDARVLGGYLPEKLADFTLKIAERESNVMVVMNTKKSALKLFEEVKHNIIEDKQKYTLYFLSTWLCAKHRKEIIKELEKIKKEDHVIVVTTQLIEAGVDLDFNCVIRSIAGLDSLIQAAGRCNRQGYSGMKKVYIINANFEATASLRDIRIGQDSSEELLNAYNEDPNYFQNDRMSKQAIDHYFNIYRNKQMEMMNYPITKEKEKLKKTNGQSIYEYLSQNENAYKTYCVRTKKKPLVLTQAFKSAGEAFEAIESDGISVIVPYKRGKDIISELISESIDFIKKKELIKEAQQYTINLTNKDLYIHSGVIKSYESEGIYVLLDQYYDEKLGFTGEVSEKNQSLTY